ncbi:zf-TFIIB domain-containing protein [Leptothoe spongobia]|uniref:Zf-TFIIB domain-containing protein n=1 Tax=Leptothoe spongobia TAU-MAC 1115 TaxID=1967444 RepID=A0A947DFX0_9CYAN|nr:zf-TFIIB domain-containing protein [Leptothoe spongobia]MBT9316175.1 zf-TFIIB domain-containing protein [Leptothoe spongobia TAU-MAC 1115]
MLCPKHPQESLLTGQMVEGLKAHQCPTCNGSWVTAEDYQTWQLSHADPSRTINSLTVPINRDVDYQPSRYDNRAGLCPNCGFYLVRERINLQKIAFFIERCPGCRGIWCDDGEWAVLDQLGLSAYVPVLFTDEWHSYVRNAEAEFRERTATAEKLGSEISEKLFELAKLLEEHPNGDFGVAYLMRRFEQ